MQHTGTPVRPPQHLGHADTRLGARLEGHRHVAPPNAVNDVRPVRALVTFASSHGSTRGVAERIAWNLRESGLVADCAPIRDVPAVTDYDAVVAGSAVHHHAWLPEAAQFLSTHADELIRRPTWLYSVGMADAFVRPVRGVARRRASEVVAPFDLMIRPLGTHSFSGVVRRQHFPAAGRVALTLMGGGYGDFRDWLAIDAWAQTIAAQLYSCAPPARNQKYGSNP